MHPLFNCSASSIHLSVWREEAVKTGREWQLMDSISFATQLLPVSVMCVPVGLLSVQR